MALTNAQKQARWRERNVVKLTDPAMEIAEMLIEMDDQAKLRKVAKFINDHLKHPDRTLQERMIARGGASMMGLNGPLSPTAALAELRKPPADHSYRVEVVTANGQRWGNGVRLGSMDEAEVYANVHAPEEVEGYVTADILQCDGEPPENSIFRERGKYRLLFEHGTCGSLTWRPITTTAAAAA